jgi:hypothetical protein
MTTSPSFSVVAGDEFEPAQLVAVLSEAYGEPFTESWLQWKHREGPWGPSRSWVAVDDEGILGVVFALPWPYRSGGTVINGARLVDGGSTPRARGRGVFREICGRELAEWSEDAQPGIVVATATPEAAGAHVKNGAIALEKIDYAYGPPPSISRARLTRDNSVLASYASDERVQLHTEWDERSLRWRLDERSGHHYEYAALAEADAPNGFVYRVAKVRGLRVAVAMLAWGDHATVRRLLAAVAWDVKAVALLGLTGSGAAPRAWPTWIRRGGTLLCVWPRLPEATTTHARTREDWGLAGVDVEGVV